VNRAPGTDWSVAVTLTELEFLACWAALDLGEHPYQLRVQPRGITRHERERAYGGALAGLRQRRMADERGPCRPLAGALRLLVSAPLQCDLRLHGVHGRFLVLGAVQREYGVLLAQAGDQLSLLPVPGHRVPAAMVELVGPLTPGKARPVNIPAAVLDQASAAAAAEVPAGQPPRLWTIAEHLVRLGVPRTDANALARMCTGITGSGQFGAAARVEGVARRGRWVVGIHRAQAGDFVKIQHGDTVTFSPATPQRLLSQVEALIGALPTG
jgi:hypothetical protein